MSDTGRARYVEVAVPLPVFQTFTYELPETVGPFVAEGSRVLVPFGKRWLTALVLEQHERPPASEVKAVERVLDEQALVSPELLELGKWISTYYFAPPGEAFRVMLPPGLLVRGSSNAHPETNRFWPSQRQLAVLEIGADLVDLTERQKKVLTQLRRRSLPVLVRPFSREARVSIDLLKRLSARGVIRLGRTEVLRSPWPGQAAEFSSVEKHPLNEDQARIFERIQSRLAQTGFHTMLVHGVTGSGKTELYLNAIAEALKRGRSALMLVPEIGLTPQISGWFRGWFGRQVAILHSGLSRGERFDQWRGIREGKYRVVVGTRSAAFAPLSRLGIIIVDEEHDTSYKQEEIPRYHGRDVALKRGQIEEALVLLGSATPQLEVFHRAVEMKRLGLEALPTRILDRPLPAVHVVDMRTEFQRHGKAAVISDFLRNAIRERIERRSQVLILLNRRGYSRIVLCRSCGCTETCRQCSISLTYHLELHRLVCHYCGYSRSVPRQCRDCGREYIYFVGEGTEKIEEMLSRQFPEAVVDRLDRDTVRRKGSVARILSRFAQGRTDILIGTQMIAKGHDFPGVTLVGVLSADQGLRLADFRAAERTFQLLTQVAGRAGRGELPGQVVIQTYFPNHYSLKAACAQDYLRFYKKEIQFRRHFRYPPFTALANLVLQGSKLEEVKELAASLVDILLRRRSDFSSPSRLRVLGPAAAPLERLKGEYRFQVLIKTTSRKELHEVLRHSLADLKKKDLRKITVDIDPVSLL